MMKLTILLVLALLTCDALAQQRTVYGPDGKVTGRITTDSQGSTTIYDASGKVSQAARPLTAKAPPRSMTTQGARSGTVTPDRKK